MRARPAHRRALGAIEETELNSRCIGDPPHQSVECIDFADEVSLAQAADRRIARHLADLGKTVRDQHRSGTNARRSCGGLAARMPPAHDNDIIASAHAQVFSAPVG